jgi:ParB family transcriptional regulator, chromosome partitioning protein
VLEEIFIYNYQIRDNKKKMSKSPQPISSFSTTMAGFVADIDISKIKQSENTRQWEVSDTEELTKSIELKGLLQPILVRTMDGFFEVVAGNRRYSACKALGWKKIACHIIELDDKQAFEVSLIENIQRKTISPLDEATAFKSYVSDFGWGGVSDLASKIGKSSSYITKRIKLLNLPSDVLESIIERRLDTSLAEEILSIKDGKKQSALACLIANRRLSLRLTRKLLRDADETDKVFNSYNDNDYINHIKLAERSFDKSITAVRIAMNSLGEIINGVEHDWVIHEILMQHKNMLHSQIDILLKEKRKFSS